MPLLEVGRSVLRYDVEGLGSPLVFAHGVGGNRVSWFNQIPHFRTKNRVVTFDHRAFGGSTDVERKGRSRYVQDLLALLDDLAIDRAILVGQSMGGGTCAAFTCQHPERVRGLVIADSLAGVSVAEPLASTLLETRKANRDLSQLERVLGPVTRARDPEHSLLYLQLATFNSVDTSTVRGTMPGWSPEALAKTGVPIAFIAGEDDVLFPPDQIAAVCAQVPGARFELIPEAGHSAYFEQPRIFNAILDNFIADLAD